VSQQQGRIRHLLSGAKLIFNAVMTMQFIHSHATVSSAFHRQTTPGKYVENVEGFLIKSAKMVFD
jgi:hypothetical protein